MAQVPGEGRHVVGRVREAEDVIPDELLGRVVTERRAYVSDAITGSCSTVYQVRWVP